MKNKAVIRISNKQYFVTEGDEIEVAATCNKDTPIDVLLLVKGDKVTVGKPKVVNAKIKANIKPDLEKGKKVNILKYKAKSRYRKKLGFRPKFKRLTVEKIS